MAETAPRSSTARSPRVPLAGTRGAAQQKDQLCGPFCAARVLVELGVTEWDGEPVDQDLVAWRAGAVLPATSDPRDSVPPGAVSWRDYERDLPLADPEVAGTSSGGLAAAIETASDGALACVPLRGDWTADAVEQIVDAAQPLGARLIANIRTTGLWGGRPPLAALLAELAGDPIDDEPAPDWNAGHFCEPLSLVRGGGGALVVVRDTYPVLGWDSHHLQPPRALARALNRGDGREGGMLVVVAASSRGDAEAAGRAAGLEVGTWDNGTRR